MIVLISHVFVYMIIPSSENSFHSAGIISPLNNYDDYFIEHVLKIPDKTPHNESDDIERTLQIVQVEDFAFNKLTSDLVDYTPSDNPYPLLKESFVKSVYADIIVPPPQG